MSTTPLHRSTDSGDSPITQIEGDIRGIKASEVRALERTYRRRVDPRQVVSPELARHLTETSRRLNRQVGVLLGRDGNVRNVIVGSAHSLTLPDIGRLRGGVGRFRGLRLLPHPLTREAPPPARPKHLP